MAIFQNNPYIWPLLIAASVALFLSIYAWLRRSPEARALSLLMAAVFVWSVGYSLELAIANLFGQVWCAKVEYVAIVSVPVLWFIFSLQYTNQKDWLSRRNILLMFLEPLLIVLLVWTNERHGLIWKEVAQELSSGYRVLAVSYGPAFWLHTTYSYLLLFGGTLALLIYFINVTATYRWQVGMMLGGALVPWLGNAMYILGLSPFPGLDLTPFAFTITGAMLSWALFRHRLLEVLPVARNAVVENMADGVIVIDIRNRIIDLNPAASQLCKVKADGVIGQPIETILSPWWEQVRGCFEPSQSCTNTTVNLPIGDQEIELQVQALSDRTGRLIGRLVVLHDVTEREQVLEALRQSEERLRIVINSLPIVLFALDENLNFTLSAGKGLETLRLDPAAIVGQPAAKVFANMPQALTNVHRALNGEALTAVETIPNRDIFFETRYAPMCNDTGKIVGVIGLAFDITKRQQYEADLQVAKEAADAANRAKSVFLANMSHELRTPLATMLGYGELLLEIARSRGIEDFVPRLESIINAGFHLSRLIDDLLDYARIDTDHLDLQIERFNVQELIEDVVRSVQPLMIKNCNQLDVYAESVGEMETDRAKVRRILFNLLENAAKFTNAGHVELLATRENLDGQVWLRFRISDTGIGLTPEQKKLLFKAFTQGDSSSTRKYGGTGLGLALSQRLSLLLGGAISAESSGIPGKGTIFIFQVPAVLQTAPKTFRF